MIRDAVLYQRRASGEQVARLAGQARALARELAAAAAADLAGTGIAPPTRALMASLDAFGPRSVPRLAEALGVTRQSTQPLVDGLIAAGWAELLPNARNRRSPLVRLTEEGRQLYRSVLEKERMRDARIALRFTMGDIAVSRRTVEALAVAYAAERERDGGCFLSARLSNQLGKNPVTPIKTAG